MPIGKSIISQNEHNALYGLDIGSLWLRSSCPDTVYRIVRCCDDTVYCCVNNDDELVEMEVMYAIFLWCFEPYNGESE